VREDEKLTVSVELQRITRELAFSALLGDDTKQARGSRLIEED
jgi:hypothetical protein